MDEVQGTFQLFPEIMKLSEATEWENVALEWKLVWIQWDEEGVIVYVGILVNYLRLESVASCFIDPTFRVDLNPTTRMGGHGSRQHFQPCDLSREFTGVCVAWFGRSPPYHFHRELK